ncbi:hypothetical protein, partial [Streptomyces flaveolus]|uniref:hypothetical protein n=1 Tax=Streptomyces flaveolus TaxID=67297 RepID=UPI0033E02A19
GSCNHARESCWPDSRAVGLMKLSKRKKAFEPCDRKIRVATVADHMLKGSRCCTQKEDEQHSV